MLTYDLRRPVDVRTLSSCNGVVSVERVTENSFVIRVDRPGWLSNTFARIVRVEPQLRQGRRYDNDVFRAELTELTPDGLDALAVSFTVKRPLDDARTLYLYWDGEGFTPIDLAALAIGEARVLADTSDVWASME